MLLLVEEFASISGRPDDAADIGHRSQDTVKLARTLILILKITIAADQRAEALARAFAAISGSRRPDGWIELRAGDVGEPLRALNRACRLEQATAIVLADLAPPVPRDMPYVRLWDRSDDFALQLAAWAGGVSEFPAFKANELIRLPV